MGLARPLLLLLVSTSCLMGPLAVEAQLRNARTEVFFWPILRHDPREQSIRTALSTECQQACTQRPVSGVVLEYSHKHLHCLEPSAGPNNQKRDLRHLMPLVRRLGGTLVAPDFYKHFMDVYKKFEHLHPNVTQPPDMPLCFPDFIKAGLLPFDRVVDSSSIQEWVPLKTVEDLKASGWDGKLDAMIYPHRREEPDVDQWRFEVMSRNRAFQTSSVLLPDDAPRLVVDDPLECQDTRLQALRSQIDAIAASRGRGERTVIGIMGITMGWGDRPDPRYEETRHLEADSSCAGQLAKVLGRHAGLEHRVLSCVQCSGTMYAAKYRPSALRGLAVAMGDRVVHPSPWLQGLADTFIKQKLHGEPFLAVHVRPYPDTCLKVWRKGNFDIASRWCTVAHKNLHMVFGPGVAGIMRRLGLRRLFVMAHPAIVPTVEMMLSQEGVIGAVYPSAEETVQLAGCFDTSFTFQALVEEAIAGKADAFLGTIWSSMTHSIAYERFARGRAPNLYLEHDCGSV